MTKRERELVESTREFEPCPFCGSGIVGALQKSTVPGDTLGVVGCGACGARGPSLFDAPEELRDRWNKRAAASVRELAAENERLRAFEDSLQRIADYCSGLMDDATGTAEELVKQLVEWQGQSIAEWEAEHERVLTENDSLRTALRGVLIFCCNRAGQQSTWHGYEKQREQAVAAAEKLLAPTAQRDELKRIADYCEVMLGGQPRSFVSGVAEKLVHRLVEWQAGLIEEGSQECGKLAAHLRAVLPLCWDDGCCNWCRHVVTDGLLHDPGCPVAEAEEAVR